MSRGINELPRAPRAKAGAAGVVKESNMSATVDEIVFVSLRILNRLSG